jgi:hypothetical protein
MEWLGKQKAKLPSLNLHKILVERDDNLKTTLKWCYKMNAHAWSMKCFLENDLFLSMKTIQMEAWII